MKNQMHRLASIAGLSVIFGSSFMMAQVGSKEIANVPFAFHAKDTALPAGKYVVKTINQGVLQIADANTGHSIMVLTRSRESGRGGSPRLTFHHYGNEYFLSQVWMPDQVNGYNLGVTSREKELAKQPGQLALATIRMQGE